MRWIVLEVLSDKTFKTFTMDTFDDAMSIFLHDKELPDRKCCLLPEDMVIPSNFVPGNYYIGEEIK